MTFLSWALSLIGLGICGIGAYLLGKHRESKETLAVHRELEGARARVRQLDEELRLQTLQDELSEEMSTPPPLRKTVSGFTESLPPPHDEKADRLPGFVEEESQEATRVVEMDVDAAMKEAEKDERVGTTESGQSGPRQSDLTREISLHSAEEMLSLSQQVDMLTDDLATVHRKLRTSRGRVQELEHEATKRRKHVAELKSMIEKQRQELKRREQKIQRLLAEVGVALSGSEQVDETLAALDGLDVTKKTDRIELADLQEMEDLDAGGSGAPPKLPPSRAPRVRKEPPAGPAPPLAPRGAPPKPSPTRTAPVVPPAGPLEGDGEE
jgi:chromosome segregation ATPase